MCTGEEGTLCRIITDTKEDKASRYAMGRSFIRRSVIENFEDTYYMETIDMKTMKQVKSTVTYVCQLKGKK